MPVPVGSYLVQVEATAGTTKEGKPRVRMNMTILEDHDDGVYKNRHVFDDLYIIGADADKTKNLKRRNQETFKAFRGEPFKVDDMPVSQISRALANALNGQRAVVDVDIEDGTADEDGNEERPARNKVGFSGYHHADTWDSGVLVDLYVAARWSDRHRARFVMRCPRTRGAFHHVRLDGGRR